MQAAFNAQSENVNIEYIALGDNWQPLFQSTLRNSLIGDAPDITHQLLNYSRSLVENDVARPIDGIPGGDDLISSLGVSSALLEAATAGDQVYAVPFGLTIPVVFYNMSLLEQAGWQPDRAPQTWEEINEAAAMVAALGGSVNGGFFEFEASNNWMFQNVLTGLGGSIQDEDGSIGFDGELGVEAMNIISDFAQAANTVAMTRNQARQAFNAGAMGILFRSASGIPSIMEAASANGFDLEVGAFPILAGEGALSAVSHGVFVLTEDPVRQEAALDYLEWAYGPEGQALQAEYAGYLPANADALSNSELFANYTQSNPFAVSLVTSLSGAGDWYTYPVNNTGEIFDAQIEVVRDVVTGNTDPAAAIERMAAETQAYLD